ncbi:Glutamate-ammonia-ligase adenylyltransferase [Pseudobythopirellula maris]|uniref:Glutamate-ammonia-ligase adenylyltransferase n=1 Tax=Pseudobythopirellula maris TaxID=2527991 RepID=A0A5C5ZV45_9BACT|nr:bifunctional [glutamate--ammonia ligase]-adenylyl-L-tyrosine phosphorylase/[glutamate--ammonia-ligase] adenylyltransferase [Pseudobythopirellula maris]TWT90918.1 Glutamate-ammonia-ligase adenylyltransferase [Pseudobythopirellula maris]
MDPLLKRRSLDASHERGRTGGSEMRIPGDPEGAVDLSRLAQAGVGDDQLAEICKRFTAAAPTLADPELAWTTLERFFDAHRGRVSATDLLREDPTGADALTPLLQLFAASKHLGDALVSDPRCYALLLESQGRPSTRRALVESLLSESAGLRGKGEVSDALRRAKRRETVRIAFGDIVRGQSVEAVAEQISYLADAIVEAALAFLRRELEEKHGAPRGRYGRPPRFCVLALGKLGGVELNYSSDIDLVFLYDAEGHADKTRAIHVTEYYDRLSKDLIRLLSESSGAGPCYRVDMRLRPEGSRGPLAMSLEAMLAYYDTKGRTWERQALIKARPIAGDAELGGELLAAIKPWVYRRYLSQTDIAGVKALKRRIERRAHNEGANYSNVKTGQGGLRDIEFVIQFLQLLNGGSQPELRTGNTLEAIGLLEKSGCLTNQERTLLEQNYIFLRRLEHRLQIMLDLQTHTIPSSDEEQHKVAIRMGFVATPHQTPLEAFRADYKQRTDENRKILDHLLHDAFGDEAAQEPEVDLVNDPAPEPERIAKVLGRYPFDDVPAAYDNLMDLATEKIRFLSTRRSRHFLASIAPRLLAAIAESPEPDATLTTLSRVSDSLGGKAALWELLHQNRPSLDLYVRLCAACPYLSGILTSNPGMIDELMDSLLVSKLPTLAMLDSALDDLTRGAEDLDPILHSFQSAQHLRVGVRDILGKDDVRDTHAALSDTAESCLKQIVRREHAALVEKYGEPRIGPSPSGMSGEEALRHEARFGERVGEPCELIVLALGKFGGREPNYHSDLDIVFLYEAEGMTRARRRSETTTNGHFFSELGQRIIKVASQMGPNGRLYEVDPRLRPTGRSGSLAVSLGAFDRYYDTGPGQLWERQALCKGRVLFGSPRAATMAEDSLARSAYGPAWRSEHADEIRDMRRRLEASASEHNLKRGPGGTVDTEFLVQTLQLRHGGDDPTVRVPGTIDALSALERGGYLGADDAAFFRGSYRTLRNVEARIRLMNSVGRHEFPTEAVEQRRLAFLLGNHSAEELKREVLELLHETRERFNRLMASAAR